VKPARYIPIPPPDSIPCAPLPLSFPLKASFFPCDWRPTVPPHCTHRLRPQLSCNKSPADILYEWVSVDTPPAAYSFRDKCLGNVVRERCTENKNLIPKLVHSVMFGGKEMSLYTFLGFLSTVRFVQPCLVLVQADLLPTGPYWDTLLRLVPNILHVKRAAPRVIFGNDVKRIEHSSDIARLEAVKTFGGLYADTDYLLLNSVEDLRQHTVVMGNTIENHNYANGIFMGKAGAKFFDLWYNGYRTFNDRPWNYFSTVLPYEIHQQHPDIPFHAINTFMKPWYRDIKQTFYDNILDWQKLHGIHLYVRFYRDYFKENFESKNSSLGQVSRHILFGDHRACFNGEDLHSEVVRMKLLGLE
ncbi:hypothetical protein BaRGS_00026046, partial [Batillaria attramentaria]